MSTQYTCRGKRICKMNMTLETPFLSILKKAVTVKMRADVTTNLCTSEFSGFPDRSQIGLGFGWVVLENFTC